MPLINFRSILIKYIRNYANEVNYSTFANRSCINSQAASGHDHQPRASPHDPRKPPARDTMCNINQKMSKIITQIKHLHVL